MGFAAAGNQAVLSLRSVSWGFGCRWVCRFTGCWLPLAGVCIAVNTLPYEMLSGLTEFIYRLVWFQLSQCLRAESSYMIILKGFLTKSVKRAISFLIALGDSSWNTRFWNVLRCVQRSTSFCLGWILRSVLVSRRPKRLTGWRLLLLCSDSDVGAFFKWGFYPR